MRVPNGGEVKGAMCDFYEIAHFLGATVCIACTQIRIKSFEGGAPGRPRDVNALNALWDFGSSEVAPRRGRIFELSKER